LFDREHKILHEPSRYCSRNQSCCYHQPKASRPKLPIRLFFVSEDNGRGGVTNLDSNPAWGDPFVAEWKAFYENVTESKASKTGPVDFVQDLELFAEMARLMREP